jgi:hypothetical protein
MRTFLKRMSLVAAVSVLAVFAIGGTAGATARGTTTVDLDPATIGVVVNDLGLSPAAVTPGRLSGLQASFPIVGNAKDGVIKHTGGLSLSDGTTTLGLTKYFIDTNVGQLTAIATVDGVEVGRIPLFDVTLISPPAAGCAASASLALTYDAAAALDMVFDLPVAPEDLDGASFGTACVSPR